MIEISNLTTEANNGDNFDIDTLSTIEVVNRINDQDQLVAEAVRKENENIARAIDAIVPRFKNGGRLIYIGAGTSGRMGTLDAVELTPTYSVSKERAFGILAGGKEAMYTAIEGAEDDEELAIIDLTAVGLRKEDTVIAIAASGRTPYAISAVEYAKSVGALTIGISCNDKSKLAAIADIAISPIVGPEVISGSTRMKAGTSQKLVLNTLSTGLMIKLGKVYGNYMVNVQPTNIKLIQRAKNMIKDILKVDDSEAEKLFENADQNVAVALVMYKANCSKEEAIKALSFSDNHVKKAIEHLKK